MQGMIGPLDCSSATHKPRNLLPVPLCPPQIDPMIEAFPQPSVKQLHEVFPYCVAWLARGLCRQIAWRDAVDAKAQ